MPAATSSCKDCGVPKTSTTFLFNQRTKRFHSGSYCDKCRDIRRLDWSLKLREEVFSHYGGYKCKCCGETTKAFLTIDHINNDGAADRKFCKRMGTSFYSWLKQSAYPFGYQVLCYNCNCGRDKSPNKICPHQKEEPNAKAKAAAKAKPNNPNA